MATYNLLRNAKVFVSTVDSATLTEADTWEILVMDDFSFSQATETQEITVQEAGATPIRGQQTFNTALNPVEWNFSTYMRPYKIAAGAASNQNEHRCLEAILWHALVTNEAPNFAAGSATACKATGTTSFDITFAESDQHVLQKLFIYVNADNVWYKISNAQVNQAEISFDINGIAMITWSGWGTTMAKVSAPTTTTVIRMTGPTTSATASLADHIVTRYTTLTFDDNDGTPANPYNIPITGGTLTINNNITYLTPETMGIVNVPIGSFTGTRSITGNVTCYLNTDATESSGALLADMLAAVGQTKNSFNVQFAVGGASAPKVEFTIPTAQLSIPAVETQDVLSVSIDFFGQGSTGITARDEMTIKYTALTATTDTTHDT